MILVVVLLMGLGMTTQNLLQKGNAVRILVRANSPYKQLVAAERNCASEISKTPTHLVTRL